MTSTFRLNSHSETLALLPFQIGFHPRRSVVAVSMHDRRFGLVQRLDLPPAEHVDQAAAALLPGLRREPPTSVLLIGYEDDDGQSLVMLDALERACADAGFGLCDKLVVRAGRWRSLHCQDPACCPPDGLPVADSSTVPAVADYVGRGVCPLADRDALASRLRPTRPLLVAAVDAAVDAELDARILAADALARGRQAPMVRRWREELTVWREVLAPRSGSARDTVWQPSAQDLARLAVSMLDRDLRDAVLAWMCPGWLGLDGFDPAMAEVVRELIPRLDPRPAPRSGREPAAPWVQDADHADDLGEVESRLVTVCAGLPERWAAGPLAVLAWLSWWRGDGAVARVALERIDVTHPGYRLAELMHTMLDNALRPGDLGRAGLGPSAAAGSPGGRQRARKRARRSTGRGSGHRRAGHTDGGPTLLRADPL
ncbi:MAG TPA: DUF4192 domain-containing protein [Dermatophilaceae bacterium]|nr:DUF4192 domain-containing protein [Dermatophilaceae bacterium]